MLELTVVVFTRGNVICLSAKAAVCQVEINDIEHAVVVFHVDLAAERGQMDAVVVILHMSLEVYFQFFVVVLGIVSLYASIILLDDDVALKNGIVVFACARTVRAYLDLIFIFFALIISDFLGFVNGSASRGFSMERQYRAE